MRENCTPLFPESLKIWPEDLDGGLRQQSHESNPARRMAVKYRLDAMMQRYLRIGRGATPQAWSHDDRLRNQTTSSTSPSSSSGTKNDDERKRSRACCVVARGTRRALVSGSAMAVSFTLVSFPEMANAAASGSVGSNSEEATIAKLLKYGRLEGDPFTALDFLDDAVKRAERMVAASEGGGDGRP